uniref:Auxin-responsive protein n=1 Tax=Araucaria cunninghamii TaxID=56994 RepID=A0A0D6QSK1_ARACU
MPNAILEKSGSERGDHEAEQQEEQGCLAVEEGDSQAGSPRQSSASDLDNYVSDEDDGNGAPLATAVLSDEVPSGGRSGNNSSQEGSKNDVSSFREHDYIGLSDGGSSCTTQEEKIKGKELDFGPKTRETELRLGPSPEPSFQNGTQKNKTSAGVLVHQGLAKPDEGMVNYAAIMPVDSEARAGKPYALNDSSHLQRWNRQCFGEQLHVGGKYPYPKQGLISKDSCEPKFFNNGHEVHPQLQDYNNSNNNGMAFLLTPKNTTATHTAGAKRVFSDAMGAAQVVRGGAFNMGNEGGRMSLDSKVSGQPQPQAHPSLGLVYPWANAVQVSNTWQVSLEQQQQHRGSFGAFPPPPTARVMMGNMLSGNMPIKEVPHGNPSESRGKPLQESISAAMRPPLAPPPPSEQQQKNPTLSPSNDNGNNSASRAAPVIGWPPIRSFRRNLAPQPKPETEGQTNAADNSFASADRGQAFGDSMFVKVNMDGVPIGRKIDLNAYDSYEKLSQALEEMFKRFVNAPGSMQRPTPNPSSENDNPLLSGTDYVLTYEDNEGDRMLVGDVPWEMFVTTVKRLRIMKSSEARGLAVPRQPPKPQGQLTQ